MTQRHFHPDAMAALSWAADAKGNITFMSPSLVDSLGHAFPKGSGHITCKLPDDTNEQYRVTINRAGSEWGTRTIWELLEYLFCDSSNTEDSGAESRNSEWLSATRAFLDLPPGASSDDRDGSKECEGRITLLMDSADREAVQHNEGKDGRPNFEKRTIRTRSVRVTHPDGLHLIGGYIDKIYDLTIVRRLDDEGYQGLLQEAWPRVQPIRKAAMRTATLRLITRSLSHNIGSHALVHLEQAEWADGDKLDALAKSADQVDQSQLALLTARAELGTRADRAKSRATMYRYLRERFEMMQNVSIEAPMHWEQATVGKLVDDFFENQQLTSTICKSEGISRIEHDPGGTLNLHDRHIGLPGGLVARHAFHLMIENIVRDCAKYGRAREKGDPTGGTSAETIKLRVTIERESEQTFEIRLFAFTVREGQHQTADSARTYLKPITEGLNRKITNDEFANFGGTPTHWGVYERVVAACLMRGIDPEALVPDYDPGSRSPQERWQVQTDAHRWCIRGDQSSDKLLSADAVNDGIGWTFHLPKPRRVVLVCSGGSAGALDAAFEHVDWQAKDERDFEQALINTIRKIPSGSPVVIFAIAGHESLTLSGLIDEYRAYLPGPIHLCEPAMAPKTLEAAWTAIVEATLGTDNPWRLRLQGGVTPSRLEGLKPRVVGSCEDTDWTPDNGGPAGFFDTQGALIQRHPHPKIIDPDSLRSALLGDDPDRFALDADFKRGVDEGKTFEGHDGFDRLRSIVEHGTPRELLELARSAFLRVVVLDERICQTDGAIDRPCPWPDLPRWTRRHQWAMAGVDILPYKNHETLQSNFDQIASGIAKRKRKPDYMFIHLGILEKLAEMVGGNDREDPTEHGIRKVMNKFGLPAGSLIVHSARSALKSIPRGKDEPASFRYCTFSSLESVILGPGRCCKLDLVRLADALMLPTDDLPTEAHTP